MRTAQSWGSLLGGAQPGTVHSQVREPGKEQGIQRRPSLSTERHGKLRECEWIDDEMKNKCCFRYFDALNR